MEIENINNSILHYFIITSIIKHGRAPSIEEMAKKYDTTTITIKNALHKLQDYHGVVLHPNNDEVWICHPFSLAPTNFRITSDNGSWYGTCAWCSLGASKLLGGNVGITTMLADTGKTVTVKIENNELCNPDKAMCVHFPIKMADAWDNVVYTCQCMQLFSCSNGVKQWAARHLPPGPQLKGSIQPLHKCFKFAREWYGNHADNNWIKWTANEAAAMFQRHGLEGEIWELQLSQGHF